MKMKQEQKFCHTLLIFHLILSNTRPVTISQNGLSTLSCGRYNGHAFCIYLYDRVYRSMNQWSRLIATVSLLFLFFFYGIIN